MYSVYLSKTAIKASFAILIGKYKGTNIINARYSMMYLGEEGCFTGVSDLAVVNCIPQSIKHFESP